MLCQKLGFKVSEAYLGYIGKDAVIPLDNNADEKSAAFVVCDVHRFRISRIQKECFELFPGFKNKNMVLQPASHYWNVLMGSQIGSDIVWCVNDGNDDRVYLLHSWKGIVYNLGRVHRDHPLEQACKWRFRRCKN